MYVSEKKLCFRTACTSKSLMEARVLSHLRPSFDNYAFLASATISVYMFATFLLFSSAQQCTMHPGQIWVSKKG